MTTHKRVLNELLELVHVSNKIEISTPQATQATQATQLTITLYDNTLAPHCKRIQFEIPKGYPFTPPHIFINNHYFPQSIPHADLSHYRSKIRKPLPFIGDCLHCHFIVKATWSPALGIKEILKEINKVQKTQRIIQEYILLKHLSNQKQIPIEITQLIHDYL